MITVNSSSQFVENVQKWVYLDTKLKEIHEKTKQMREMKGQLLSQLHQYATENQLDHKKIIISDGELVFAEKREYPQLSYSYIHEILSEIIPDSTEVDRIIAHLKTSRKIKTVPDIRRTYK